MQLSMRTYVALLWGISALLCTGSMSASIPETSTVDSTAEVNETTNQLFSTGVAQVEVQPTTWQPPHESASVTAKADTVTTLSPEAAPEEPTTPHAVGHPEESTAALVDTSTAEAAASSKGPQPLHTSPAEPRATSTVVQSSPSVAITETTKPTATTSCTTSTDTSAATSASNKTSEVTSVSATISAATSASAATSEATSATTSAVSLATEAASSSPPSRPTTEAEVTSTFSSTASSNSSTRAPDFTQNLSSRSASTATTMTATPITVTETTTTSTEFPTTSQPVSVTRTHNSTSEFTDTARSTSTAEPPTVSNSTVSSNTSTASAVSTSPTSIFIHIVPKRLPIPTTTPIPAATTPLHEVSKTTTSTAVQPCSSRGLVKTCLIAIASLAGLATIFIMSTIILCTKLSARKYKMRRPEPATEMMCISALLPEANYSYARQRNPVTNGILVMHRAGDSDEDAGDNLTLSSFLPENERYV